MTVDYEPAPKPTPLWMLPLTIAVLAFALLFVADRYTDREVGGFGGGAQPSTPMPATLVDGSTLPPVPEQLTDRFGDDVVLARRLDNVPRPVRRSCRDNYKGANAPSKRRLHRLIRDADLSVAHLGPDVVTGLWVAVGNPPPGYPREVVIACSARPKTQGWRMTGRPLIDFALSGRPGVTLPAAVETSAERPAPAPSASQGDRRSSEDPTDLSTAAAASETATASEQPGSTRVEPVRTRVVQVPVGAMWAVQPRGGWWLAYEVGETSWTLMSLNDAVSDRDPLRVVFVDATGNVVTERAVGPTRSAALADHSTDYELVAGSVREILDRLDNGPVRRCEPGNRNLCVWLSLNEFDEVLAYAAFGPHPLDTPPMGYVGYCPAAEQFQGTVTPTRFNLDGSWAGGPVDRGLDRYAVRFEAGEVVVDLSEHVVGDRAEGNRTRSRQCRFPRNRPRGRAQ